MQDAPIDLIQKCRQFGQEQLLAFWSQLSETERGELSQQIASIDFEALALLHEHSSGATNTDWSAISERAEPPIAIRLEDPSTEEANRQAWQLGCEAIQAGKVAMILVAGGQGTRLGFDQPKGMFQIGPLSRRSLFEMHVDSLKGMMRKHGISIPLFVMTSPATDAQTREYFASKSNLGLKPDELIVFCQGTMPAIDAATGKILLESRTNIALSPDGHGGIVHALEKHGCLSLARSRGIEHFFYAQVDNPLVTACDPLLVGHHIRSRSQMTTQVVQKRFATEKVGNVVQIDGRTQIIEYSDLPKHVAEQTNTDGTLKLWAGNIAIHVFDRSFLEIAATQESGLPFHRARKSVPYLNADGEFIKPAEPNAIKFERFVFDLLPLAARTIVIEGSPEEVFAPVKNADGSPTDTPTTARQALIAKHRRMLEQCGITVAPNVRVEINPNWALDVDELREKFQSPAAILVDTYLV